MRLRIEKTVKTFYTYLLDEEDSQRVVDNAKEKNLSLEDSLQDLVDNDPDFYEPYMHEIGEDEWYNYVDEEYEPKGEN